MAIDRVKEIEKIADRLGIGQDREIECVGCKKTFRFKDAVILTEGTATKYMCKDCYQKILSGKLTENQDDLIQKLIEIQQIRKTEINPKTYPEIIDPPIRWEPAIYELPNKITYSVRHNLDDQNSSFMALVPQEPSK